MTAPIIYVYSCDVMHGTLPIFVRNNIYNIQQLEYVDNKNSFIFEDMYMYNNVSINSSGCVHAVHIIIHINEEGASQLALAY